jgi:hypothetical protein
MQDSQIMQFSIAALSTVGSEYGIAVAGWNPVSADLRASGCKSSVTELKANSCGKGNKTAASIASCTQRRSKHPRAAVASRIRPGRMTRLQLSYRAPVASDLVVGEPKRNQLGRQPCARPSEQAEPPRGLCTPVHLVR